jgi:hypothetical protein
VRALHRGHPIIGALTQSGTRCLKTSGLNSFNVQRALAGYLTYLAAEAGITNH